MVSIISFDVQTPVNLEDQSECLILKTGTDKFQLELSSRGEHCELASIPKAMDESVFLAGLEYLFGVHPKCREITYPQGDLLISEKLQPFFTTAEKLTRVSRESFFQIPNRWHRPGANSPRPELWTHTNYIAHPERPLIPAGLIYQRYLTSTGKTIQFTSFDLNRHLDVFHDWHHQAFIADIWELNKPKAELAQYILDLQTDPHVEPIIYQIDGKPVGYIELYWCVEDRLGPYYPSEPYDRGIHFLIGNTDYLGPDNFKNLIRSLTHMAFLQDIRSRRVMGEPKASNQRLLKYLPDMPSWNKLYEFDFPHKRAALLQCRRQDFFSMETL